MRDRIWKHIINIKFKALYTNECSRLAGKYTRILGFSLATISAASVATWAIWKQQTTTWAVIIGIALIIQIAIPFIPFLKHEKELLAWSFELESLYLEYEELWHSLADGTLNPTKAKARLKELRRKELEINKSYKEVSCPEVVRWKKKIKEAT